MLKNHLKDLNSKKLIGKSIEMINQSELSQIKGGKKLPDCPNLQDCDNLLNIPDCGHNILLEV